jgi:Fe-S-cluster containining protein
VYPHRVRDGVFRAGVKRVARAVVEGEGFFRGLVRRARGQRPVFVLGGACQRCARCCEAPSLQVGTVVFHLPAARRAFVWWQVAVNQWSLTSLDRRTRTLTFACAHFDAATRSCDSYATRPAACRDYPRNLMDQPSPDLLPGCGYRPVASGAQALQRALDAQPLTAEQRERLARELRLR